MVAGSAPSASPSRVVSASPRVMIEAFVLSPKPIPSAMPTASAMTFLTAPPSSTPTTSVWVYGRKYGAEHAAATCSATSASVQATTVAVGCRAAISLARFGPDTTAMRPGDLPVTSAITSLMRRSEPCSTPFMRLTSTAASPIAEDQAARLSRRLWDGTASTTIFAPSSTSPGSVDAVMAGGSGRSSR